MSGLCISGRPAAVTQCQSPHAGPALRARLPGAQSQPQMRSRTASPGGAAAGQGRACVTVVYTAGHVEAHPSEAPDKQVRVQTHRATCILLGSGEDYMRSQQQVRGLHSKIILRLSTGVLDTTGLKAPKKRRELPTAQTARQTPRPQPLLSRPLTPASLRGVEPAISARPVRAKSPLGA